MAIFPIEKPPLIVSGGLLGWFEASNINNFIASGDNVSQWNDISGNNNHITQSTGANQPTINTASLNGKNVLNFDGVDDFMKIPSGLFPIPGGSNTVFFVSKRNTEAGTSRRLLTMFDGTTTKYLAGYSGTSGQINFTNNNSGTGTLSSNGNTNTNYQIIVFRRSGTTQGIGVNSTTETTNTNGGNSIITTDGNLASGLNPVNGTLAGAIAELILYNQDLSSTQRQLIINYLNNKWGIF